MHTSLHSVFSNLHTLTLHPQFPFLHIYSWYTHFLPFRLAIKNTKSSRENHLEDHANLHIKDNLCCL